MHGTQRSSAANASAVPRGARLAVGLAGALGLALALRALGFEHVFVDSDTVVLELADANYHARRAFWTLQHFPWALSFDPYLNYPNGAAVPWPPLLDWTVAAVSLALGGSRAAFERVAAWTPAVLGTLALLPIFALGRRLRSAAFGLGAATIFACLPIVVIYAHLGNLDHHAAQPLIGASLLLCYVALLDAASTRKALAARFAALAAARLALLLSWQGSLLYLGPCELAFTLLAALGRRNDLLIGQSLSALATLALAAAFVGDAGVGGRYSAIALSRLHLIGFAALALVCAASAALERSRPSASGAGQAARLLGLSVVLGLALLALPGPREGLRAAAEFVLLSDDYGNINLENQSIFRADDAARALAYLGGFAYLLPLAPLVFLLAAWRRRVPGSLWLVASWLLVIAPLAVLQRRYLNDFAPAGCLAFAWMLASIGDGLRHLGPVPAWLPRITAALLGALLLAPVLPQFAHQAAASYAALRNEYPGVDRATLTPKGTLVRFGRLVRDATPPTSGLYESDARPEYGILSFVGIGHALHWVAERATPADNFGPYIGQENYRAAATWFHLDDEQRAVASAQRLGARYVVSHLPLRKRDDTMQHRLHVFDGSEQGRLAALGHFRLITEGPLGGRAVSSLLGARPDPKAIPYKLFQLVEGAELVVAAEPGARITARIELETPTGRRFHWISATRAGEAGAARLRLPYPSSDDPHTRALGPYQVFVAGTQHTLEVSEDDVLSGRELSLAVGRVPR